MAHPDPERPEPSRAEIEFLRLGRDAGIPVTDTFPLFRADQDWNSKFLPGDVHRNKTGAALVADALAMDLMAPSPTTASAIEDPGGR